MNFLFAEFEKAKSEIENKMYARFLPILNAKKAQISELLSKADQEGNDMDMDESAKRSRLNFSSSDEDENEDENEDEEMEEHP